MEQTLFTNDLYLNELKKTLKKFGYSILESSKHLDSSAKSYDLNIDKEGIKVAGHKGTWYVISDYNINDQNYFLLEHEKYGDEAACIITNASGKLILNDVYNGFDDLEDFIFNKISLSGAKDFVEFQIMQDFENKIINEKEKRILEVYLDSLGGQIKEFFKINLPTKADEIMEFARKLFKDTINREYENNPVETKQGELIWKNQNDSVKVYDLNNGTFGLSISYGRKLPTIIKQGIERVIEHLESEFGLSEKDKDEILENLKTYKDKSADASLLILDSANSIVGRVERDGSITALDYCLEQIKGTVSNVRQYLKRFNMAENIKVEALKNYRLLSEYNNIALGCMITEEITQFATWETNAEGDDYYWGHYFGDDYAKAKEDFSERAGLHAKPQFSEIELKLIFSSLQFSGKTGDLDFDDLKSVEKLKEKISDLIPELKELEEDEINLGIEPDYPV